jgi:hypothetical protein
MIYISYPREFGIGIQETSLARTHSDHSGQEIVSNYVTDLKSAQGKVWTLLPEWQLNLPTYEFWG